MLLIICTWIISIFIGHFTLMLLFIFFGAFIQQTILISQLERWLSTGAGGNIPKGKGIWENIYYHFYCLRNAKKKRKKQLSKIIKQFRQSTDVLPDAAIVLGENNEIEWSNKLAKKVLGLKKVDKGQRLSNLIRSPEFILFLNTSHEDETLIIISPINSNISLQIRLVKYGIGQRLLIAQDITQQQKIESMRKNFVDNVSHELRTPLTVLKGYLETLQDINYTNNQQSELLGYSLTQMYGQTERMQYLVDDLLLLARLETQQQKVGYVDIIALINIICMEIEGLETQPRIELHFKTDSGLYGEEADLYSAFSNLIVNALKYSPPESTVKVIWSQKNNYLYFDVIDTGEGIAEIHIPRITERFYRIDIKRNYKLSGTGLGLAIVKHVLMRHEAKLIINSQPQQGSHFSCEFPKQALKK